MTIFEDEFPEVNQSVNLVPDKSTKSYMDLQPMKKTPAPIEKEAKEEVDKTVINKNQPELTEREKELGADVSLNIKS